jgi:hypothetical protein
LASFAADQGGKYGLIITKNKAYGFCQSVPSTFIYGKALEVVAT